MALTWPILSAHVMKMHSFSPSRIACDAASASMAKMFGSGRSYLIMDGLSPGFIKTMDGSPISGTSGLHGLAMRSVPSVPITSAVQSLSAKIPVNSCAPMLLSAKSKVAMVHSSTLVELSLPVACKLSGFK